MSVNNNNWYVITGAPSSGKTTVLNLLTAKGYQVAPELAREVIDRELKQGKTIEDIRSDELDFQKKVLEAKVAYEKNLDKEKNIFFDRAIPDSQAYYKLCGVTSDDYLTKVLNSCSYKKVFLFELLDYDKDYARVEDQQQAQQLEKLLYDNYYNLGMPIVKVSRSSPEERLDFILKNIE
jgi:predicted ATPase